MDAGMTIPHISDVGAFTLKPFFITGSVITTISLDLAFLSERYLRYKGRLARNATKTENVLSNLSLLFAIIGTAGLILLSIFDSYRYGTLHNVFLFLFMGGYIISAIFICWAYQRLGIRKWIAVNYSIDNTEYYRLPGTPDSSHLILGQVGVHYCRARVRNWYFPTTSYS
jgi:xanthine/uracil permease